MKTLFIAMSLFAMVAHAQTTQELERKLNVLASEVEALKSAKSQSAVTLGGYGEIVYIDTSSENEEGDASGVAPSNKWDTLRNVLYVGYKFSDKWSFKTEIEIEHANEIYTEFAELRFEHSDALNFKAGLLLAPIGFINTEHEPTRFFGVSRPGLENGIIPTTWRENGFAVHGKLNNFSYGFYILNSLNGDKFSTSGVRDGRQKGANATAGNWAYLTRVDYRFAMGLDLGATAYISKTNGTTASGYKHNIYDLHAQYSMKGFKARVLYVKADIDGKKIGEIISKAVADTQTGYYAELGYDLFHGKDFYLAPYVRYETYNTQEDLHAELGEADKSKDITNIVYGIQYKPVDKISFKLDYLKNTNEAKTGVDKVSFGLGWEY